MSTVYTGKGDTVSFFAHRGEQYKATPPSKHFAEQRLPGNDGSFVIKPAPVDDDLANDPLVQAVAPFILDIMAVKSRNNVSQACYRGIMAAYGVSGRLTSEEKVWLGKNGATAPKAKKLMEKLGMGMTVYVYHICSNTKCAHIYRNETKDADTCPCKDCLSPRYKDAPPGAKKVARRKMFYLPVHDWLLGIRKNTALKDHLEWLSTTTRSQEWATDVYDAALWKVFRDDPEMARGRIMFVLIVCVGE